MNREDFLKRLPAYDKSVPVVQPQRDLPRSAPMDGEASWPCSCSVSRNSRSRRPSVRRWPTLTAPWSSFEKSALDHRGLRPGDRWEGIETAAWTDDARDAPFASPRPTGHRAHRHVVLRHEGEAQRGLSLLPPATGFFLHASNLVDCLGDVLEALDVEADRLPTASRHQAGRATRGHASVRCCGRPRPG